MNATGKIAAGCLAAGLVIALPADGYQPSAEEKERSAEEQGAILDTIAQINHINWVWNTIKTYNNVVVLEEEYDKISSGNLNMNRIPDEETLGRITQMLDTLYSLRKDDRAMKRWRQNFRESRERKQRDFKTKAAKEAKDRLVAQAKECCSFWNWATNPLDSLLNVANTAYDMTHYAVSLHNDYDNFVYGLDKEASDKEFSFDTAKMDLLHQQNKALLEDQWKLIRRYNLDDRLRVSDNDIRALLSCLRGENHEYIFRRLLPMRERFSRFPEYWYYFSCAAMETGHFKEGLEACDTFFKVNRGIFRDDPMEGTIALNKAFMLPKTDANKPELRRCLELAWKANDLRGDWQISYLSAIMYKGVFDEKDKAEEMLENAIALIDAAIRDRKHYGSKAGVTLEEGLRNCRNALHQLRGEPLEEAAEPQKIEVAKSPKQVVQAKKTLERVEGHKDPKTGDTKTITLPGGATMEMIYCGPGSFMMGSPTWETGRSDSETQHKVTLTKGFWLGKYEVTQEQWQSVMGNNPSNFKRGNNYPVDSVSWEDCQRFISMINSRMNCGARLPTEAEWEYACRAGTTGPYGGTGNLDDMGWYGGKGFFGRTRPVGQKRANTWGFHDMHGNVCEWCYDWYGAYYGAVTDPSGPASPSDLRVIRGGSWNGDARLCRSAYRGVFWPGRCYHGFRLCCSAGPCE